LKIVFDPHTENSFKIMTTLFWNLKLYTVSISKDNIAQNGKPNGVSTAEEV
jgi:hypothetical protein